MTSDDSSALNQQLATLLPKCSRSDEKAFTDVYALTSANLFAVLVRSLGMNATAEQALQDTYIKIWQKADEYHPELGQPMTWLTSIARSHATQLLRERRSHQTDTGISLPEQSGSAELAEVVFLDKHLNAQTLESCLNQLEEQPRDCIVRAYAEGLSHEELSALHDSPIGTVRSWIHRALLSLKGCSNGLT